MSSDLAIAVRGLSKRYELGRSLGLERDLRETLARAASAPARLLRREDGPRTRVREHLWALDDVSFDVARGDVVGIIGRNGAGKTTLLKVLSRITSPTRGEARVWGRVGSLLEVGTGFHPDLTGRENVYLNGAILGMRRAEIDRRFDEIVAFAEVERFVDTPVKRYSSGMYLRLAFSVAAHLEPEILIVDEVLAVGDAAFQRKCLGKMGEVSGEGRTVVLVSHNMSAILSLATTCIWLDSGRVREIGLPDRLVADYLASDIPEEEPGFVDLASDALRVGNPKPTRKEIRFRWVRLLDRGDETSAVFFEGEPLRISLGLDARVATDTIETLCSIRTLEGTLVFTCTSGVRSVRLAPGEAETSVVLPASPLRPGRYQVDLYLRSTVPEDYLPGAVHFEVVGSRTAPEDPRRTRDYLGLVNVEQEWAPVEQRLGAASEA